MTYEDRQALVWWHCVSGVGWVTVASICEWAFQHTVPVHQLDPAHLPSSLKVRLQDQQIDAVLSFSKKYSYNNFSSFLYDKKYSYITSFDTAYPKQLLELDQPPHVLFIDERFGSSVAAVEQLCSGVGVAVVGSRKMTPYGSFLVEKFVAELVLSGAYIISGGMVGVDLAAHLRATQIAQEYNSLPRTVCVLGYGFEHLYPARSRKEISWLRDKQVPMISEFPPWQTPSKGTFIQRNRIVAGLAQATLVIEAAANSGSLITAHCAMNLNRVVGAVPGLVSSQYSNGCHQLIKEGAECVTSVEDILSALPVAQKEKVTVQLNQNLNSLSKDVAGDSHYYIEGSALILRHLSSQPAGVSQLAAQVNVPISIVQQALTELELSRKVVNIGGIWWKS